jgi:hypothetical protein
MACYRENFIVDGEVYVNDKGNALLPYRGTTGYTNAPQITLYVRCLSCNVNSSVG